MTIATRGATEPPDPTLQLQGQTMPPAVVQQPGVNTGANNPAVSQTEINNIPVDDNDVEIEEITEPEFPHAKLATLDEKISNLRWVVPVLPEQELECLLNAAIDLCRKGQDVRSEACQRFFREGLTISFTKILTDDAVSSWKSNIHLCIYQNCLRLIELCVIKLDQDWFPLLDLLAMVLNPSNKFHTFNVSRQSETVPPGSNIPDEELYARPPNDSRIPRGWLVDLINRFGQLGGFQKLTERFLCGRTLSLAVVYALIKPFGLCYEFLTVQTVVKYIMPILEMVPSILDKLSDDELKREAKNESKNDLVAAIIKAAKCLASRAPHQDDMVGTLEEFRLKMILRQLQISSFNGKMNALNEINKVIGSVGYYPNKHHLEEEDWLTSERMTKWLKDNNVIEIVLRDSLHQPQYVDKLEKILRFIIKERALSLSDLDAVWSAQAGKHEAIVKNVHDLLAKLAWDFSPEQLDHLFDCFQSSWTNANRKQREKLLELIRRLAEDDKDGVMAHKVLTLFWNLAHSEEVPTEIMDQALTAHVKILDYSCSQERDAQKTIWLDKCVDELKAGDQWVLPALKQIRDICCLYEQSGGGGGGGGGTSGHSGSGQCTHHVYYRQEIIDRLQNQHSLVILVTNSLITYMEKTRALYKEDKTLDPIKYLPDRRYNHILQVQERLNFLRFLLKDGQLWLCADQAKQIWQCLAENAVFVSDREACFKWFSKLMGEEPDLDPGINKDFFENNILQLDPVLLTESGMKCFERFFKAVNTKEGKLKRKRHSLLMDDPDLIGTDYLWRVVTNSEEEIANRAIELLKEVNTNLGPRLQASLVEFHENYISECCDRLRAHYDNVSVLSRESITESNKIDPEHDSKFRLTNEAIKMCRVMKVLHEYITECDGDFNGERKILPLHRACRGKHLTVVVRFSHPGRQIEDLEVFTHSNDTIAALRRAILRRIKASSASVRLELFLNGDPLDTSDDRKTLAQIPVRDKILMSAKLSQVNSNMASSPESSSDSSTSSPQHPYDGPNLEAENTLPGVLMSKNSQHAQFFWQLQTLGSVINQDALRDGGRAILQSMPPDQATIERLHWIFRPPLPLSNDVSTNTDIPNPVSAQESSLNSRNDLNVETVFFGPPASQVLYHLEVLYALLMPAADPLSEKAFEFQNYVMTHPDVSLFLEMLTRNNFMPDADLPTKRSAYLSLLKICKFLLTVAGNVVVRLGEEEGSSPDLGLPENTNTNSPLNPALALSVGLRTVPGHSAEQTLRTVAVKVSHNLAEQMLSSTSSTQRTQPLFTQAMSGELPTAGTTLAIVRLAWAASSGNLQAVNAGPDILHTMCDPLNKPRPEIEDVMVCKEALETLTVALVLNPATLDSLGTNKMWQMFIIDLLLLCPNRAIRVAAAEQFMMICTYGAASRTSLQRCIQLLFSVLDTTVIENADNSHEYFQLLCLLLNRAFLSDCTIPTASSLLNAEIQWLRNVRDSLRDPDNAPPHEAVLEGHLGLAKELLSFMSPERKYELGSNEAKGGTLIKELIEDFIFPPSKQMMLLWKEGKLSMEPCVPVCGTGALQAAAFDLLVGLSVGCAPNCQRLVNMLTDMFYSEYEPPLQEWDYLPPVGPRPVDGFVGLKNAGATCYMNSVLQQLYMVESIRVGLLACDGAATDPDEDFSGEERLEGEANLETNDNDCNDEKCGLEESRKEYNIVILKQVQAIFGHLAYSRLQYYIPRGLWRHFRLLGEPVNLREQQDAVEFFTCLVESIDEAFKALGHEQIMSKILGGSYSDQKICKDCPHRYSKEEPFSIISVDIRNHSSLQDSMEQYVKGELLEGPDAYYCEKCARKVVTVKRLCVKKLPPILAIQLKRFEYDYDRLCPTKFNDYFEFPRDLDMEPYTVSGLAKLEGEEIDCDLEGGGRDICTRYRLSGIVVHSGQASGGHYYSYILNREAGGLVRWYKFDDGEVTECRMHDDEEMKAQCFGGEYMGEVFDNMLKRVTYRRQKRWWNAYMLFYTRLDIDERSFEKSFEKLSLSDSRLSMMKMPVPIENSVRKQNIKFLHHRSQFPLEYFSFIRKLVTCNAPSLTRGNEKLSPDAEQLSMISVQLAARFLFHTGFHTKKNLRGAAADWYDVLCVHLRASAQARSWFAYKMLFRYPHRFCEYLLSCPVTEVRSAFMKIIVFLAHFSLQDGPSPPPMIKTPTILLDATATLSDHLLHAVLSLLHREVSEHGRHLPHYFTLFHMYAALGIPEKAQLLKLNVPTTFMQVAIDEGPGPAIKYQYPELSKLHQVVITLVRCCDISAFNFNSANVENVILADGRSHTMKSEKVAALPNPFGDPACPEPIMTLNPQAEDLLFKRHSYLKKVIEDTNILEDCIKLLQYCSWENPHFSRAVLCELLWQVAFAYFHDLRHYFELLLALMLIEDSWQTHRVCNALNGIQNGVPEEREGIFESIQRSKNHYQKRAYQCIKFMVTLFSRSQHAYKIMRENADMKEKWISAVDWLHDEMERKFPGNQQYNYNAWSPPAQSNDNTNGFFLERSNSARKVLERALELCPEEETEPEELSEHESDNQAEDLQPQTVQVMPVAQSNRQLLQQFELQHGRAGVQSRTNSGQLRINQPLPLSQQQLAHSMQLQQQSQQHSSPTYTAYPSGSGSSPVRRLSSNNQNVMVTELPDVTKPVSPSPACPPGSPPGNNSNLVVVEWVDLQQVNQQQTVPLSGNTSNNSPSMVSDLPDLTRLQLSSPSSTLTTSSTTATITTANKGRQGSPTKMADNINVTTTIEPTTNSQQSSTS